MSRLIDGYKQFFHKHFVMKPAVYKELATKGQKPHSLVIACSDSRCDPGMVFSAAPGEIFVARHIANLVPSYDDTDMNHAIAAAIEFAVTNLKVSHIIVLGHSSCGGIKAVVSEDSCNEYPLVGRWVEQIKYIVNEQKKIESDEDLQTRCEHAVIKASLENLRTYPFVNEYEKEHGLVIHGWYFDFDTGHLLQYRADNDTFFQLD